jgi:adenylate cyclase
LTLGAVSRHPTVVDDRAPATLAPRAGVDVAYVLRLIAVGALAPDAPGTSVEGDVRRIHILQALERAGLPLDGIGEAIRRQKLSFDFVEQASYRRFSVVTPTTFSDLAAETGLPLDIVLTIREALGFARPAPDDCVRTDELEVVPLLAAQARHGVRPQVIERALRAMGEALRRAAETEAEWWRSEILRPLFERGASPGEVGQATERVGRDMSDTGDAAVLAMYHGQQANAWMRNIFEGVEAALAHEGLHSRLDVPPAICFLDLTGYTRLTEERGDEAAAELARRLAQLVQVTSAKHGGKPVKWLGDGVMFHFREPGPGVVAALEMVDQAVSEGLPPAHVGLHAGPVLFQEGDYFGRTVNAAARIADYARQGEVVVSQEVVDASGGSSVVFREIGPVELKGLSGALRLHVAHRPAVT